MLNITLDLTSNERVVYGIYTCVRNKHFLAFEVQIKKITHKIFLIYIFFFFIRGIYLLLSSEGRISWFNLSVCPKTSVQTQRK